MFTKLFKAKNKKPSEVLVFDLGKRHIKAFLLSVDRDIPYILDHMILGVDEYSPLEEICFEAKEVMEAKNDISIKKCSFVLSGDEIFGTKDFTIYRRKEKNKKISSSELEKVIDRSLDSLSKENLKKFSSGDLKLSGSVITSFDVDGLGADSPVGLDGSVIKIGVITFFSRDDLIKQTAELSSYLNLETVSLIPLGFSLPHYNFDSESVDQGIFLDIGSKNSTVSIVKNSDVVHFFNLSVGSSLIDQEIAKSLGCNLSEAEKYYLKSNLTRKYKVELESIFRSFCSILFNMVDLSLAQAISEKRMIMSEGVDLFFCGGILDNDLFFKTTKKGTLPSYKIRRVIKYLPKMVSGVDFDGRKIFSSIDTPTVSACAFLGSYLNENVI